MERLEKVTCGSEVIPANNDSYQGQLCPQTSGDIFGCHSQSGATDE